MNRALVAIMACASIVVTFIAVSAADQVPAQKPISGYDFMTTEVQQLQDDDFANPGLLWVEEGQTIWDDTKVASGKSCASCHGDAATAMRGVATRYPAFSSEAGHVINLEQQINQCRRDRQGEQDFPYESEPLLSITAFVSTQSRGLPQSVAIVGPAAESFERGKAFFYQRRGQLNLSCANCHEQHAGDHLRGESISQGQLNGFPIYRALWQTMGSTHRMFAWCNEAVRAEPYPAGSQEYVDLELFERWRGQGLNIETPAVRR